MLSLLPENCTIRPFDVRFVPANMVKVLFVKYFPITSELNLKTNRVCESDLFSHVSKCFSIVIPFIEKPGGGGGVFKEIHSHIINNSPLSWPTIPLKSQLTRLNALLMRGFSRISSKSKTTRTALIRTHNTGACQ